MAGMYPPQPGDPEYEAWRQQQIAAAQQPGYAPPQYGTPGYNEYRQDPFAYKDQLYKDNHGGLSPQQTQTVLAPAPGPNTPLSDQSGGGVSVKDPGYIPPGVGTSQKAIDMPSGGLGGGLGGGPQPSPVKSLGAVPPAPTTPAAGSGMGDPMMWLQIAQGMQGAGGSGGGSGGNKTASKASGAASGAMTGAALAAGLGTGGLGTAALVAGGGGLGSMGGGGDDEEQEETESDKHEREKRQFAHTSYPAAAYEAATGDMSESSKRVMTPGTPENMVAMAQYKMYRQTFPLWQRVGNVLLLLKNAGKIGK